MAPETKHLELTLETQVESVNVAEEMCLRVAEAAGFGEDDCYRIGMSVREGVINAFHYGNQEKPEKKIHLAVDLTPDKMIIHVADEGTGFLLKDVPDPLAEENLLSTSGRGQPGNERERLRWSRRFSEQRSLSEKMALHLTPRDSGVITVVDASGRITLGDGSANLRKTIRQLVDESHANIVLNLADVDYIDSSGIGELVSAYTAVRSKGGELKLLHLTKKVHD